jgi:hypothetical protein
VRNRRTLLPCTLLSLLLTACSGSDGGGGGGDDDDDDDDSAGADASVEVDSDTDGCLGEARQVPPELWVHVVEDSPIEYANEPPASGAHYPVWAQYGQHGQLPRGYWVHNLEHGAVVLVHSPDAPPAVVSELRAAYQAIPNDAACGHQRTLLAEDTELQVPVAVIAAHWVMTGDCVDTASILAFVDAHRNQAPVDICTDSPVVR